MKSLQARLSVATGIVLIAFVAATGYALQRAASDRAVLAQHDKLQGLAYAILGSGDISRDGTFHLATKKLPETALARVGSGLYAMLLGAAGQVVWHSPSLAGRIPVPDPPDLGEWVFRTLTSKENQPLFTLAFGLRWVVDTGENYRYTLVVAENAQAVYAQVKRFRNTLLIWLILGAILLLALQFLIVRWGMSPMNRVVRKLHDIEAGKQSAIDGNYPSELEPLVASLNAMLASERKRLQRYRNSLGDLAHSLKGPLAILRGLGSGSAMSAPLNQQFEEQLGRINEIVDYQLQRAATAGTRTLAPPVELKPQVDKIVRSLEKVYRDSNIDFAIDVPGTMRLSVDAGDITEILGNLLDNAAKYGEGKIRITARRRQQKAEIVIEDNGAGFPVSKRRNLLERGVRADTRLEGQGIGLSLTAEIVHAYDGKIELDASSAGGAQVRVILPAAG